MTDWRKETRACACGEKFRLKRQAQTYCSERCRNKAVVSRRRSGDKGRSLIPIARSGDMPSVESPNASQWLSGGSTMVWPEPSYHRGPTPGAPQGDDYPLEHYEDGYPKLPVCLDRNAKPLLLAEAA